MILNQEFYEYTCGGVEDNPMQSLRSLTDRNINQFIKSKSYFVTNCMSKETAEVLH